ncbi:MAG TPA: hypothetical protein VH393_03790 [Ktedonobacterales bacterium]|jgi:hypothetical protein
MPSNSPRNQPDKQARQRREPPAIPPALLSVEAAGAYLGGLSRSTIIKMISGPEPELRSLVYRRRRLLPRGECDAWLRRTFQAEYGEEPPTPDAA